MDNDFTYQRSKPDRSLSDFVESFWMLQNRSGSDKEIVVLPDGRIDLFFSQSASEPFHATLSGIETHPDQAVLAAQTIIFAISFRLPAVEYIFRKPISGLLNDAEHLPAGFWDFTPEDLHNFNHFCAKATQKVQSLLPADPDSRKLKLFELIYASNGALTVNELSEQVSWSSRQINRYFTEQFGIPLKAYCNILRFRASFEHIRDGKLFPEHNFTDQSHFIREVKKLAGVSPKELRRNQNDRFIQFSTLPPR
jgi:AraC-like DNA-binding protein